MALWVPAGQYKAIQDADSDLRVQDMMDEFKAAIAPPAPPPPVQPQPSAIPTTAAISNPTQYGGSPSMTLDDIYRIAKQQGHSDEGARTAMSIAQTEGGLNGAAGDSGQSTGPFQFYSGTQGPGQLDNYAAYLKTDIATAREYARQHPTEAATWALSGYLGNAIKQGESKGFTGADLATYTQDTGQVSKSPGRAGQNYNALFGGAAQGGGASTLFPVAGYKGDVPLHWGSNSGGTDLFAAEGTPVVAMRGGKVISSSTDAIGGNAVLIQGDDGNQYYYAHLDRTPAVKSGQAVAAGDYLGGVGDTGNAKGTGAHLHMGIGPGIVNGSGPQGGTGGDFNAVGLLQNTLAQGGKGVGDFLGNVGRTVGDVAGQAGAAIGEAVRPSTPPPAQPAPARVNTFAADAMAKFTADITPQHEVNAPLAPDTATPQQPGNFLEGAMAKFQEAISPQLAAQGEAIGNIAGKVGETVGAGLGIAGEALGAVGGGQVGAVVADAGLSKREMIPGQSPEDIQRVRDQYIKTQTYFMVNNLGMTPEEAAAAAERNAQSDVDAHAAAMAKPYAGGIAAGAPETSQTFIGALRGGQGVGEAWQTGKASGEAYGAANPEGSFIAQNLSPLGYPAETLKGLGAGVGVAGMALGTVRKVKGAEGIAEAGALGKAAANAEFAASVGRQVRDVDIPSGAINPETLASFNPKAAEALRAAGAPPVESGFVRLYRGETPPLPANRQGALDAMGGAKAKGRWFVDDPESARWYSDQAGDQGQLTYVDVPADVAQASLVKGKPGVEGLSMDPAHEFILPQEYISRSSELVGYTPPEGARFGYEPPKSNAGALPLEPPRPPTSVGLVPPERPGLSVESVSATSAAHSTAQPPTLPGQIPASVTSPPSRRSPQSLAVSPPSPGSIAPQSANVTPPIPPRGGAPRPQAAAPYSPQGPQKDAGLREFWDRTRNVIAAQGPYGEQLAKKLYDSREFSERFAGALVSDMPTVRALTTTGNEFDRFVAMAEGQRTSVDPVLNKALAEWTSVRDKIWNAASSAGIKIGKQQDYFPHTFEPGTFSKKQDFDKAVQHLVTSGQAKSVQEAEQLMYRFKDVARGKHGNLEASRLANLPGYKRDKEALFGYVESAADRIGQAYMFGPKYEQSAGLLSKIRKSGYDDSAAKHAFNVATGSQLYGEQASAVSGAIRAFNVVTKMGLSLIANAGQSINTATVAGTMRTLRNIPDAFGDKAAADYALKIGVTLDGVLNDLREGAGFSGNIARKVGAPGFQAVERFNRTLATIVGKEFAADEAIKAAAGDARAVKKLGEMGLNGQVIAARGGQLTQGEIDTAARRLVERTQFKVDPQDLPVWADSPWGKLIAQFRTFSYNQSAFMGREVIAPALDGDVRPLMRFLILAPVVGAGSTELRNLIANRPSEEDPAKRIVQYYQKAGGLGIVGDLMTAFFPQNVQYLDPNRYTTMALGSVGGPSVSLASDVLGGAAGAVQGNSTNLERFALRQVPVAGTTLQNTLLPYKTVGGAGAAPTGDSVGTFLKDRRLNAPVREFLKSRRK